MKRPRINQPNRTQTSAWVKASVVVGMVLALAQVSLAQQWTASGNNINNTNPGNVGVGTSAPEQVLHAHGTEILSTGSQSGFKFRDRAGGAADNWVWYSTGNVARLHRQGIGDFMSVNTSGYFGVGTLSPLARTHLSLESAGTAPAFYPAQHDILVLEANSPIMQFLMGTGGEGWVEWSRAGASPLRGVAGIGYTSADNTMHFVTANDGTFANQFRRMVISGSGNVGIGTVTPGKRLDVRGSIYAGNSISLGKGVTDYAGVGFNRDVDTGAILDPNRYAYQMHREVNGNKFMFEAYTQTGTFLGNPMVFDGTRVGIGTTSPAHRLDVAGNVNASGLCLSDGCKTAWSQVGGGTGGGSQWTTIGSSVYYGAGNVGVGTSAPGARLDVGAGTAARGGHSDVLVGTGGDNAQLELYGPAKSSALTNDDGAGGLVFYTNGPAWAPSFFVAHAGNVGVGTTTPAAKLHVEGDLKVTGNIAAKYQDLAEWVPSAQKLSAGTVVVLDMSASNHVVASASAYDTKVAGVISAQPGIALGEAGEGKLLVATTGRVRVKVDATRGAVKVGDLLVTSDREGVAMISVPLDLGGVPIHRPGTVIGKALEPLEKGVGEILVLLSLQ